MKAICYSFITILLLSAATCKKAIPGSDLEKKLIGVWKYTGKSGGYAGKQEKADPATLNTLEFKSGHLYIRKINDEITAKGKYELYKTKSIYSGKEDNAIRFESILSNSDISNDPARNTIVTIQNDSLTIADNVYDGFKSTYIRIK